MNTVAEVVLTGRHVRLEPLRLDHVPALLAAATQDRETYGLTHVPATLEAATAYVETALANQRRGESLPFATVDAQTSRVIGSTRFCAIDFWSWFGTPPAEPVPQGPDGVEIGWTWLTRTAQRTAINTEAKRLMLAHAFEVWGVRRVTLKTDSRNARSRAAIERLGCHFDGVLRAHMPAADGGIRDSAMYSLLRAEWPAARAALDARLERR